MGERMPKSEILGFVACCYLLQFCGFYTFPGSAALAEESWNLAEVLVRYHGRRQADVLFINIVHRWITGPNYILIWCWKPSFPTSGIKLSDVSIWS